MNFSGWTDRFLRTTRGRILLLLRQKPSTVAEMSESLGLTRNAVRAHLATLERDGLVHQTGEQAGFRKPHFSYELTREAGDLFSKAYAPVLNQVVTVMKDQLGAGRTEEVLREAGHRLVPEGEGAGDFEERLEQSLQSLAKLGGEATIERKEGKVFIRSNGCPLSAATSDHGEICKMVETILSEVIGAPVRQTCQREASPRCCFEVQSPGEPEANPKAS